MRLIPRLTGALALLALSPTAPARAAPGDICVAAARDAAAATGVPVEVLLAITLVETGRTHDGVRTPWPWTINDNGDGAWFDSREDAIARAEAALAAGRTSFDTGCFQINYRWHAQAFPTLAAMFDPAANALHAARFLAELHDESGDWSVAAGAYHSRTAVHADRYRVRFDETLAELTSAGSAQLDRVASLGSATDGPEPLGSRNAYPLLRPSDGRRAPGSLVPLDAGG